MNRSSHVLANRLNPPADQPSTPFIIA
jgi:hypothetical protein